MSSEEFISLVLEPNMFLYFICLIGSIILYYLVYRKYFLSILDPLFLSAIFSIFGFSVVLLLFTSGNIKEKYFYNYIFTQAFFFLGYRLFINIKFTLSHKLYKVEKEEFMMLFVFIITTCIYIYITLLSYYLLGVPLLQESRLDINANAQGGLGILSRFTEISGILSIYFSVNYFFFKNKVLIVRFFQILSISFFILSSILSGSKSSFMILPTIFFCFAIMHKETLPQVYEILKRNGYKFMIGATIGALLILSLGNDNVYLTLYSFVFRLIGSGDVYWYAYPNDTIEILDGSNAFTALFQSFLGFFRIIPHSEFPQPLGYTLVSYFYDLSSLTGANARHNVFGYVYFGEYGSYVFSFVIGSIIGLVRHLFLNLKDQGIFFKLLIMLLYINIFSLETDPTLFSVYLNNVMLVLAMLFVFIMIIVSIPLKESEICHK